MTFKGDIIITDPCYFIKDENWENSDYGQELDKLGFENYFCENILCGDWICGTYRLGDYIDPISIIDAMNVIFDEGWTINMESPKLGEFTADAGLVGVFLLDEVRKYNPEIDTFIKEHPRCVTIIPNFDGEVEYYIDENNEMHIYGTGNITFFTDEY